MRYRIRTHVAGGVALGVIGCPNYTERVGTVTERHQLNCRGIGDIAERQELVDQWFDMAIFVPPDTPSGEQTLSWELDPPFHASEANQVEIRTRRRTT